MLPVVPQSGSPGLAPRFLFPGSERLPFEFVCASMQSSAERERVAHLLRRFGLGASQAEVDYYGADGYDGAVRRLIETEAEDDGFPIPLERFTTPQGNLPLRVLQGWWYFRLCATRHPFRERMTLFWHDHFATSAQKVDVVGPMESHLSLLREYGLGQFAPLLARVTRDPAMLYWLDNQFNVKGKPNENFAREVMELFTLGIGHYTELDVQEAARAFTGYTFAVAGGRRIPEKPRRGAAFHLRQDLHDDGRKSILGHAGPWNGDDVLRFLTEHPQTALHLTRKFWEAFVYPNPEPAVLERYARIYRESGLDTRVLAAAVARSPEFSSPKARRSLYKSPVDFAVVGYRQLGLGRTGVERALALADDQPAGPVLAPFLLLANACKSMGMDLMYPPDVAGWDAGPAWITTATMVERLKWADRLFGVRRQGQPSLSLPAGPLMGNASSPDAAVDALLDVFDAPMPAAKRAQLIDAAQQALGGQPVTPARANAVATAVLRLVFGAPEFQFA